MCGLKKIFTSEAGNISILSAFSALALLLGISAAIDLSHLVKVKDNLQNAVDAAALSGVLEDKTGDKIKTAVQAFEENFTGSLTRPLNVRYDAPNLIVTATIEEERLFPLLGPKVLNLSADAAATIEGSNACIYVLDPAAVQSLEINLSGTITSACAIQVNSNNATALQYVGSGTYNVAETYVVGGASITNSGTIVNQPQTNASVRPDPLQGLPEPNTASLPCDFTNEKLVTSSSATLNPGVYCGGLEVIGSGTVNLNPGQYIMRNGPLDVNLSGSLNGSDVIFILEGDSAFDVAASGNSRLSAPTTGTYSNILVFQSRSGIQNVNFRLTLSGVQEYIGTVYAPRASMIWAISGTTNQPSQTPLIVNRLEIAKSGTGEFSIEDPQVQVRKGSRLVY